MNQQPSDPRVGLAQNRTGMAKFRTQIALDRTTLAWIRTTLSMVAIGFGSIGFFRSLRQASPALEAVYMHEAISGLVSPLPMVAISTDSLERLALSKKGINPGRRPIRHGWM